MAFSPEVIRIASARLEQRSTANQTKQRELRQEIYREIPEIKNIERQIRAGILSVTAAAFGAAANPEGRVAEIREENKRLRAKRSELLAEAGYEPDCLDDKPVCPHCSDRGWVGSTMCTCLQEFCTQEQMKELSSMLDLGDQSFDTFSLEWYGTEPNESLGISDRENMALVLKICRNYAQKFGKYIVHNLFLTGEPGLGKTFLSAAIAREVSEKGYSVVYDTAGNIFMNFENAKFNRSEEAAAAVERYLECDLLILDDLGSELTSQMTQSALYNIVNSRMISDKHTVISSNLTMQDVRRRYQPMIASRLEGEYRELQFVGRDIRIQRKNRGM